MTRFHRLVLRVVLGTLATVPLLPGQTTRFRFIAWADTKTDTDVLARLSNQITKLSPAPVFTIYPGDLENAGFTSIGIADWTNALNGGSSPGNGMINKTFAVRGNHDDNDTPGWQAYFNFAAVASAVGARNYKSLTTDLSYSFDYGNARFIGLDGPGNAQTLSSGQVSWLDSQLAEAKTLGLTHAFIFFHGPIYCLDGHCNCSTRTCVDEGDVGPVTDVINKYPIVSATFHGHEHVLAHVLVDNTRVTRMSEGRSFHQFVSGTAGAGPNSCDAGRFDWCLQEWGFATVDVDGSNVTVTFYQDGSGSPQHTVTFSNGSAPPPPSDTTPPTVSIIAPSNGATVSGTVTIEASATDSGSGVANVEFFRSGSSTSLCTDSTSPYTCAWDTTAVSNGSYALSARARDNAGNQSTIQSITVTVSNTAPPPPDPTAPAAPSNLIARAVSATQINLAWTDNSAATAPNNETNFEIQRSTNRNFTADLTTVMVGANQNTYSDNSVTAAQRYFYRVRAHNTAGDSAWSNWAAARTPKH